MQGDSTALSSRLAALVCLVCLVRLVEQDQLDELNKPIKRDRPIEQDKLEDCLSLLPG
jgi:hypothetical protein